MGEIKRIQGYKNVNAKARSGPITYKTKAENSYQNFKNYDAISISVAVLFRDNTGASNFWFCLN